jgi:predicted transposase/invertase (TIGR01784 family)
MQMEWTTEFKQRVMFNAAKAYVNQLDKGDRFSNLQPVYSLNLVNDIFEPDKDEFYHYYRMVHERHSDRVIEGLHLVFVELKKFNPKTMVKKKEGHRDINNFMGRRLQVLWLRFLTEINAYTEEVPQELLDNPEISKAISLVEESAYNREQLLGYDMFWDRVSRDRTLANDLKRTKEQLAQVEAQAKQKLLQTARNLKAMNMMTTAQVAEVTGLTAEEIEGL